MNVYGELVRAQAELLSADPSPGITARVFFNTTNTKLRYDDGTSIRELVDLNQAQTLLNKSLTDPVLTQSGVYTHTSTPSAPSAGFVKLYAKSNNLFYKLDSAGNEVEFGTGAPTPSLSTQSGNYTVLDTDGFTTIVFDDTTVNRTCTLPTASDNTDRVLTIKNVSTDQGLVTVDGEGAETIDGLTTIDLDFEGAYITVQSNGSNWFVIAENVTSARKTYNLTVTGTNWTTGTAKGTPFRDLQGNWKIIITLQGTLSVGSASVTTTISGVTFLFAQSGGAGSTGTSAPLAQSQAGNGNLVFNDGAARTFWQASGVFELSSKPTFVE